jgi:hypothetical protein
VTAAPESLRAEVEAAVRERRLATLDDLGADAVLWLAAPPVWTRGTAEAAGFPVPSLMDFVRRACAAGWCKARSPVRDDTSPDLVFWMPDEVRRQVVDVVRDRLGPDQLELQVGQAAVGVAGMASRRPLPAPTTDPDGDEFPGALATWGQLMTSTLSRDGRLRPVSNPIDLVTGPRIGTVLVMLTQRAVADRDLGRAQDLVAAGEAIAGVHAGTTEQALSRARRLLALGLRRRQDERALGRYLDRPELSDAVARLLNRGAPTSGNTAAGAAQAADAAPEASEASVASEGHAADGITPAGVTVTPEAPWALHLRGVGGVGKTMLIRYLASGRYAAERELAPIPVARVDFDHIRPDYPVRRPVQLLLELADELALHTAASDRADQALTAFRFRAQRAHEAVSGLREAGGSPLRHPEVALAVDRFGDALAELGDVLLILDTCEELAKADTGDPAAPAVRATLDIIERLHERAPSVRVLFAGRRPLPDRPYLAVQPVAGFTQDEARRYLTAFTTRPVPTYLADEMLRQSAAVDGPVPDAGQLPGRVSPFDLALYAAWACEDPDLDVTQVRRGSDAYIEGRIIERLDDPLVVRALPVLASFGRCRVGTIAEFLDCDPGLLGRRLAEQEWIDADGDPPVHVLARPALARRLRRYFESDERRDEFSALTRRLASALLARLREDPPDAPASAPPPVRSIPLADIDADELISALRLAEPADAAALWDAIAERATEPPGGWGMVLNLTRRILGEWDEEEWPTTPALRATVAAAHIAASRRDSTLFDARGPWETVRAWAAAHPDPDARQNLRARASLGLLPYAPDDDPPSDLGDAVRINSDYSRPVTRTVEQRRLHDRADFDELLTSVGNWWNGEGFGVFRDSHATETVGYGVSGAGAVLLAAVVDAAHRLLEADRSAAAGRLIAALPPLGTLRRLAVRRLSAWALVARARVLADSDLTAARDALTDAGNLAAAASGPEPSWPDWIPPDDLPARVWIERGLIAPPDYQSLFFGVWESYAAGRLDSIDGERLASLCLRIRLRHGVANAAGVAEHWEALDGYVPDRVSACTAHDLVPPLFVSVAQAWLAAGRPERALALLDRRRGEALGTRLDEATVRHADAAEVAIVRRLRLADRRSLLTRLAADPPADPADGVTGQALRTLGLLGLPLPATTDPRLDGPENWHARWQGERPQSLSWLFSAQPRTEDWRPARTSAEAADIRADREELRGLFLRRLLRPADTASFTAWDGALGQWLASAAPPAPPARTAEPHEELRARLRMAALTGTEAAIPPGAPPRLLAELAFEEAELIALRLPGPAAELFMQAVHWYTAADDALGELLACLSILRIVAGADASDRTLPDEATARQATDAALAKLTEHNAALAATLTGPLDDSGPWRYWAEALHRAAEKRTLPLSAEDTPPHGTLTAQTAQPAAIPAPPPSTLEKVISSDRSARVARPRRRFILIAFSLGTLLVTAVTLTLLLPVLTGKGLYPLGKPGTAAGPTLVRSPTSSVTGSPTHTLGGTASPHPSVTITIQSSPPASASRSPTQSLGEAPTESQLPWIVALITGLAALALLSGWFLVRRRGRPGPELKNAAADATETAAPGDAGDRHRPKIARLAAGRGVGAARLRTLVFTTVFDAPDLNPRGSLYVTLRPWRTAPPRVRAALCFLIPIVALARLFRGRMSGYPGFLDDVRAPTPLPSLPGRPTASPAWWHKGRGTALGVIRTPYEHLRVPWERALAASLGPDAAGRVEWVRLVVNREDASLVQRKIKEAQERITELLARDVTGVDLDAPTAWRRALPQHHPLLRPAGIAVRHVIGRAVATSAGPVMSVTGEASSGTTASAEPMEFLGVRELTLPAPGIVVLQAEPTASDTIGATPPDDQAEKLKLAAELAQDGIPAVILLPVVPGSIAVELAQVIIAHAKDQRGVDPLTLLRQLRAAITPHVPPQVLDDVILILNERSPARTASAR